MYIVIAVNKHDPFYGETDTVVVCKTEDEARHAALKVSRTLYEYKCADILKTTEDGGTKFVSTVFPWEELEI